MSDLIIICANLCPDSYGELEKLGFDQIDRIKRLNIIGLVLKETRLLI
jgi:hypothetical protein